MAWQLEALPVQVLQHGLVPRTHSSIPESYFGRREPTPSSCPLTSRCALWHTHVHIHIHILHTCTLIVKIIIFKFLPSPYKVSFSKATSGKGIKKWAMARCEEQHWFFTVASSDWHLKFLFIYSICFDMWSHYIAQADFELKILLSLPEFWDHRCVPPWLAPVDSEG